MFFNNKEGVKNGQFCSDVIFEWRVGVEIFDGFPYLSPVPLIVVRGRDGVEIFDGLGWLKQRMCYYFFTLRFPQYFYTCSVQITLVPKSYIGSQSVSVLSNIDH